MGPKKAGRSFPIKPTRESRAGIGYRGANGSHIENYGERDLEGEITEGKKMKMKMVVADVTKVLASVARMCESGNRVVFDEEGSYIECKATKEKTPIQKRNGVYVVDMWVKKREVNAVGGESEQNETFTRLGAEMI